MAAPTRTQLENWKRPALQQKCKELGVKANGKSEVLIELILAHYQSQRPDPSKPSTSTKRKAAPTTDADEDRDEQIASGDVLARAPQRQIQTRRRGARDAAPPPAKLQRIGTSTRVKAEPSDHGFPVPAPAPAPVLPRPHHGRTVEIVLDSPKRSAKGKAKGKAKEVPATDAPVSRDGTELEVEGTSSQPQASRKIPGEMYAGPRPLQAYRTAATELDFEPVYAPQAPIDETRITDLELQLRNIRKLNDEASRDIKILSTFRATIEDAFCHVNSGDPNFPDSMTLLAKLRDITPKLVAMSSIDLEALAARVEVAEQRVIALEAIEKRNGSTIAELKDRIWELEKGKSAVEDPEAIIRRLQFRVDALSATLLQSGAAEDSGTERVYTPIRGLSYDGTAWASYSQTPLASLSVPTHLVSQDPNQGRASSISRPPLAEKGVRPGQPDVEVKTTDPRRSIPRLAESSLSGTGDSAPPSRGRGTTPSQREPSSGNPTPSQGRLGGIAATVLDTIEEEVGDTSTHGQALGTGAPTTATSNLPGQQLFGPKVSPAPAPATNKSAVGDAEPERLSRPPPAPNPSSSDTRPPRSPARFFEVGRGDPSGSPPASASSSSGAVTSPIRSLASTTRGGPIMELPFKLVAPPTKPQAVSSLPHPAAPTRDDRIMELPFKLVPSPAGPQEPRPAAPIGRVPRASVRNSHQPYSRPLGGSRKIASGVASVFNFASPGASSSTLSATTGGPTPGAASQLDNPAGFATPARSDFGQTPGGSAFEATGRAPPSTPAATTTLLGTEVARDTRVADSPYDPDAGRGGLPREEPGPSSSGAVPRNTTG